jgi:hypothetical protein
LVKKALDSGLIFHYNFGAAALFFERRKARYWMGQ